MVSRNVTFALFVLCAGIASCGGDDSPDDLEGTWEGTLVNQIACGGPGGESAAYQIEISQAGDRVSIQDGHAPELTGTAAGTSISASASAQRSLVADCIVTTQYNWEATSSADRQSLDGTFTVAFSYNASASCPAACTSVHSFSLMRR